MSAAFSNCKNKKLITQVGCSPLAAGWFDLLNGLIVYMCAASVVSAEWLDGIVDFYDKRPLRGTVEDLTFPTFPWITPRIPESFINLVISLGRTRKLQPGEYIYSQVPKIDHLCIVLRGITVRSLVNASGIEAQGNGVALPKHIACGNLNFFSQRPCCGCYYTLTPATIAECSVKDLKEKAVADNKLLYFMAQQFEMCALSDRLVFASKELVSSAEWIKTLLCSWAANFGSLVADRPDWIRLSLFPPVNIISKLLGVNWLLVQRTMKQWEIEGLLEKHGDEYWFPSELVEGMYRWVIRAGFEKTDIDYPKTLAGLLATLE